MLSTSVEKFSGSIDEELLLMIIEQPKAINALNEGWDGICSQPQE